MNQFHSYIRSKGVGLLLLLVLIASGILAQGQWVWMKGSALNNQLSVYGTKGVANATNTPGARYEAVEWTDLNGNFWLYGGSDGSATQRYSDLWKYDPSANMWTWVNGSNTFNQPPVYGTKGVPSTTNSPGTKIFGACSWTDNNGNLWLFGGGLSISLNQQTNDLWKYNIATNEWTWMNGTNIFSQPSIYGTKGVPNAANTPGNRSETSCTWTDNNGNLWLFGGIANNAGNTGYLNDLWKYDPVTNMWTWMSGSNLFNQVAVYGTQGVAAPGNVPGNLCVYASWKDLNGDLWLFGGGDKTFNIYNDLWKYAITTNQWTWMGGSKTTFQNPVYGVQCSAASSNTPGGRVETRSRWIDDCGNFWLYGGAPGGTTGYADLWKYNVTTNKWTWVSGDNTIGALAVYGTIAVAAAANHPGGRMGAVGWKEKSGNFWIFGGINNNSGKILYNSLFKYIPDKPTAAFSLSKTGCIPLTVSLSNNSVANCGGDIKNYLWSFGDTGSGIDDTSSLVNPSHIYNSAGNYIVKLVVTNCTGQKDSTTQTIVVNTCSITVTTMSATICSGSCATVTSSGAGGLTPYTYSWSNGATTQNISPCPIANTTYTVTIRDTGGNTSTSTAVVTVNPIVTVTTTSTNITCNGSNNGSATASASGGSPAFIYNWSTGSNTFQISNLSSQIYTVTVTDIKGCTATSTVAIASPPALTGQFTKGTGICAGCGCKEWLMVNVTGGTSPYNYSWPDGYTNRYKNHICPGSYAINVTDKNGCSINVNLTAP